MQIRRLKIRAYRGLGEFEWNPRSGLNCLIGPGDAGKSTVLSAISLLLSPNPSPAASEFDYHKRELDAGFEIEAVLACIDDDALSSLRVPVLNGWNNAGLTGLPEEEGSEQVLVGRVLGSPELEVMHQLVPPSDEPRPFPASLRQRLPYARIAAGEWASREFRLGRGSLLEKHIGGSELRGQLRQLIAEASTSLDLPEDIEERVAKLQQLFRQGGLPEHLLLGVITPAGTTLSGLVGLLTGEQPEAAIPLAFSGAGTRNLALFRLATALAASVPLVVFDEPEVGLEPYRQRALIAKLRELVADGGQAFLTTHSPAILEALDPDEVWRVVPGGSPTPLGDSPAADLLREAPGAFLSKLPVLCEGPTEAGFLRPILDHLAQETGSSGIDAFGVHLVSRKGQPSVLNETQSLTAMNMRAGLFVDAEDKHGGTRDQLSESANCCFGSWKEAGVRNVEEAVALHLPTSVLLRVLALAADLDGRGEDRLRQQVNERASRPGKQTLDDLVDQVGEEEARRALAQAMNECGWFKDEERGRALGSLLVEVGLPDPIASVCRAFWAELQRGLGM